MNIVNSIERVSVMYDKRRHMECITFTVVATNSDTGGVHEVQITKHGEILPEPVGGLITIPDPEAVQPSIPDPDWEPVEGEEAPSIPDPNWVHPLIEVYAAYTQSEIDTIVELVAINEKAYDQAQRGLEMQQPVRPVPPPPPPPETDAEKKQAWFDFIDTRVAFVYNKYTRFQIEYEGREAAAKAYKDAGYSGPVDTLVSHFADNIGIDYHMAADVILSQAANLRGAVKTLSNLRMDKYKVKSAATIELAEEQFNTTMAAIDAIDRSLT